MQLPNFCFSLIKQKEGTGFNLHNQLSGNFTVNRFKLYKSPLNTQGNVIG